MKQPVLLQRLSLTEEDTSQKGVGTSVPLSPGEETRAPEEAPTASSRPNTPAESQARWSQNSAPSSQPSEQRAPVPKRMQRRSGKQTEQKSDPELTVADVISQLRLLRHESALLHYLLDRAQREFLACDIGEPPCRVRVGSAVEPALPDAVSNIVQLLDVAASARDVEAQELLDSMVRQPARATSSDSNNPSNRRGPVETGVVRNSSATDVRKKRGL